MIIHVLVQQLSPLDRELWLLDVAGVLQELAFDIEAYCETATWGTLLGR